MKNNWLNSIAFAGLLFLSSTGYAQQKNAFSVKQCVDYAEKNSVAVKNALLDIDIQRQQIRQTISPAFPQVNASLGANHYYDIPIQNIPDFVSFKMYDVLESNGVKNGSGVPITNPKNFPDLPFSVTSPWNANASIDIQQLLFDGQVFIGLVAKKMVLEYAKKTALITQEQIKANIYKIYYQLVVGKKQMGSLDANIERFEKLLSDTKEIFKNGFAERLDVDKVTVQLNNIKTEKIKVENTLAAGYSGLKFLMSMPQSDELVLTDTLSEDQLKDNILDAKYDYTSRAEIQVLTLAEKLGRYNVKRYQLSKIPTVAAFGNYSKNAQRSSFNFFNNGDWFTTSLVGIKMSIPIFDGFKRAGQIQQAKLELQKTKNSMEQMKQSIDHDATTARINMTSALLTMDNQKKNIDLAEAVYNTTKKKFEQGLGNNQEIYNAQAELKVAQTNYYSSLYDAINAKIDYLKAIGKL